MNIFIQIDGEESGPYSWVEIFVLLRTDTISPDVLAQLEPDGEFKSLDSWDLWREGHEVGPITWEEVTTMLNSGVLDVTVPARFEGEDALSPLGDVIDRSSEVEIVSLGRQSRFKRCLEAVGRLRELVFRSEPRWIIAGATGLAVLLGIALLLMPTRQKREANASSPVAVSETLPQNPSAEAEVSEEKPPAPPASIATLVEEESQAEFSPVLAATPVEPVQGMEGAVSPESESLAVTQVAPPPPTTAPVGPSQVVSLPTVAPQASPDSQIAKPAISTPVATSTPQSTVSVSDFFKIESIKLMRKAPKDGIAVWRILPKFNDKPVPDGFRPSLEVKVSVDENTRSDKTFARAYFYGSDDKLVSSLKTPSKAGKGGQSAFEAPVLYYKDKPDRVFFEIPEALEGNNWKALIVFGDKNEAQVVAYPATTSAFRLDYPEKKLVEDRSRTRVARKPAMDPLIEHVVRTKNPQMPQMTLFLRPPKGITDASEVQGVLAICILANGVEDMKRELQKEEMPGDYGGLFSFANKHKLAIIAWGSRGLWDAGHNYDELSRDRAKQLDESFDLVSTAWARGVKELGEKYGIPQKNFLLWGNCGSAQFAARLCLRKPQYFLAVHIHMPGSYDKPTPEAAKVLWCLTIGELEAGYERSKRWVKAARTAGYPILYKAFPGLGHAGHPDAAALGFEFFEFAMRKKTEREQMDETLANTVLLPSSKDTTEPWLEEFRNPPYYGDFVNQEVFPKDDVDMIPLGFRTAIPNKAMVEIWKRNQ